MVRWDNITEEYFLEKLTQFLFSPRGAKYKNQFKFSSKLSCGKLAPSVLVSSINYQHKEFDSASQWVPAMDRFVPYLMKLQHWKEIIAFNVNK